MIGLQRDSWEAWRQRRCERPRTFSSRLYDALPVAKRTGLPHLTATEIDP